MSTFSEESLVKRLKELNQTQQAIETLSLWLIHHRKHHKRIAEVWMKTLLDLEKASRKLTLLYLANDVIQNSKRKGPEFSTSFIDPLDAAFRHMYTVHPAEEKILSSIGRILSIWKDRRIYDEAVIGRFEKHKTQHQKLQQEKSKASDKDNSIQNPNSHNNGDQKRARKSLGDSGAPSSPTAPPDHSTHKKPRTSLSVSFNGDANLGEKIAQFQSNQKGSRSSNFEADVLPEDFKPPEHNEVIRAILALENASSTDAVVREKIASLPREVSDAALLQKVNDQHTLDSLRKQVEDACNLLNAYNGDLDKEITARGKLATILHDFRRYNAHKMREAEKELEVYKQKLSSAIQVRDEVRRHANKLPDMSKLPNVQGSRLGPLPTAGDLFTK
ncbi:regulation of nuclear pre-mRNA domain-containing protein 1B-like isoform X1 [Varroa destructor]|uniref:CID domain-containing protein n=2 Tax=Varroa destructor TaxID=109461 RepID=A0A7M7KRN2_VARDE|nr:regulation of nuclear pre-mRNA domain-containing protein 1B-like isoform X1 [Varroa destructor]XP_022669807.1 regulation of nuclear pre-mRNA domain-containing protein 1B-like isoform X1 [Varroa destructor]